MLPTKQPFYLMVMTCLGMIYEIGFTTGQQLEETSIFGEVKHS